MNYAGGVSSLRVLNNNVLLWAALWILLVSTGGYNLNGGQGGVEALFVEKSFTTTSYITVFQKFAFDANGTLHFDKVAFHPPSERNRAFFYLCDTKQWSSFVWVATEVPEKLCQTTNAHNTTRKPAFRDCALSQLYFDDPILTDFVIPSADMYRFILINCPPEVLPPQGQRDDNNDVHNVDSVRTSFIGESESAIAFAQPSLKTRDEKLAFLITDLEEEEAKDRSETSQNSEERTMADRSVARDKYRSKQLSLDLEYVMLNPGGTHLPLGSGPLPMVYAALMGFWFWLVVFYGVVLVWKAIGNCGQLTTSGVSALHWVVIGVLASKLSVVSVAFFYWQVCDDTGRCYSYLQYLQSFLFAVSESLFFASLLVIAKGWRITRWSLPGTELRTMSVALILLLATLLFFSLYSDSYYFLSLMIMYFFMLPKILSAITTNLRELKIQIALINRLHGRRGIAIPPNLPPVASLSAKFQLFKYLRVAIVLYLVFVLIVSLAKLVVSWGWVWLPVLCNEVVMLGMIAIIAFILRPRELIFSRTSFFEPNDFRWFNLEFLHDVLEMVDGDDSPDRGKVELDGQVAHVSELVVFQFPSKHQQQQQQGSIVITIPGEQDVEKGKEKEKGGGGGGIGGGTGGGGTGGAVCMYPLSIGIAEPPPKGKEEEEEKGGVQSKKNKKPKKKKKKSSRRGNNRRGATDEENVGLLEEEAGVHGGESEGVVALDASGNVGVVGSVDDVEQGRVVDSLTPSTTTTTTTSPTFGGGGVFARSLLRSAGRQNEEGGAEDFEMEDLEAATGERKENEEDDGDEESSLINRRHN